MLNTVERRALEKRAAILIENAKEHTQEAATLHEAARSILNLLERDRFSALKATGGRCDAMA